VRWAFCGAGGRTGPELASESPGPKRTDRLHAGRFFFATSPLGTALLGSQSIPFAIVAP
jgi:hypothetical protein